MDDLSCQNSRDTVQLLHKLQIRGVNGSEKLLKVIKASNVPPLSRLCNLLTLVQNPVTDHLPVNTMKLSMYSFFRQLYPRLTVVVDSPFWRCTHGAAVKVLADTPRDALHCCLCGGHGSRQG